MADKPARLTQSVQLRELYSQVRAAEERIRNAEGQVARHDFVEMEYRVRLLEKQLADVAGLRVEPRLVAVEEKVAELAKARDTTGNRLFQIGVAILTAQFALIVAVIAAVIRK